VDLFLTCPFERFENAYERAVHRELASGVTVSVVGRDDLLTMKQRAGRPRDFEDIRALRALTVEDTG
jgi:hypothetical protein